jgi:hypothetical protein
VPVWCVCVSLSLAFADLPLSSRCGESPSSRLVIRRDANARGFPAPRRAGDGGTQTDGRTVSRTRLQSPAVSALVGRERRRTGRNDWTPDSFFYLHTFFFSSKLTIFLSTFPAYCNPRPKC